MNDNPLHILGVGFMTLLALAITVGIIVGGMALVSWLMQITHSNVPFYVALGLVACWVLGVISTTP